MWERFSDAQAELRMRRSAAVILARGIGSLEPHFPDSPTATIEHYYSDSPTYRIYNLLVKAAIEEIARLLPEGRRRCLQIIGLSVFAHRPTS
jgi:hypothetical protein